jgi:hypothetical protein
LASTAISQHLADDNYVKILCSRSHVAVEAEGPPLVSIQNHP